jgi:hypothetical protein
MLAVEEKGRVVCFITKNYRNAKSLQSMEGCIYGCPEEHDFVKKYSAPLDNKQDK